MLILNIWMTSLIALSTFLFNPIQDGGGGGGGKNAPPPPPPQKRPPSTSFSSITSANVGINPENFLTFSFNPFATRVA